jgi:hypothetical protein
MIKKELWDVSAYLEAYATREAFEQSRVKAQAKLKQDMAEKEKLNNSTEQKTGGFFGFNKVDKGKRLMELTESIKAVNLDQDKFFILL